MIRRHLTDALLAALGDTPVVLIHGPRQSGKSTLARWIAENEHSAKYFTLDNAAVMAAARRDPDGFIRSTPGPIAIDEAQLVPDLFRAIKLEVDRQRTPGRFLLTGSANVMMLPRLSESLVGRIEILTLWPFSQGELAGTREVFVDRAFEPRQLSEKLPAPAAPNQLLKRVVIGGFPEVTQRPEAERRRGWFGSYITTILQRDVREIGQVEELAVMPQLLSLVAAQSGGLMNVAGLSREIGLTQPTVKRYLTLLQAIHLYQPLSAWSGNARKRLVKTPKAYLNDTGLLAYLLGLDNDEPMMGSPGIGTLLEAFVHQELRKQIGWSEAKPSLYYYRTADGHEVDFVLEKRGGQLVGIEVKASVKLDARDLRGLEDLADAAGRRFQAGILLYQGTEAVPFGPNLWALPISALFTS